MNVECRGVLRLDFGRARFWADSLQRICESVFEQVSRVCWWTGRVLILLEVLQTKGIIDKVNFDLGFIAQ
jgi:hypothetical protein